MIYGGQTVNESDFVFYDDVWAFDTKRSLWSQPAVTEGDVPKTERTRNAHVAVIKGDEMFIVGGSNQEGPREQVLAFNLGKSTWTLCGGDQLVWVFTREEEQKKKYVECANGNAESTGHTSG